MLELDDIVNIHQLAYSSKKNHTVVIFKDGSYYCSCRLYIPVAYKSESQLIVGNVDA